MYMRDAIPPPPEAFWTAIEHGRLHAGDMDARAIEWQRMQGQGVKKGLPDLMLWWKRTFVGIELKVGPNKPSDEQLTFGTAMVTNGFHYEVARSVCQLDGKLREIGFDIPRSMMIAAEGHDAALSMPVPQKIKPPRKPRAPRASPGRIRAIGKLRQRILF